MSDDASPSAPTEPLPSTETAFAALPEVATVTVEPAAAAATMPIQMDMATYQAFLLFQQKQQAKEGEKKEKKDKSDKKEKKDKSDKKEKKDKQGDKEATKTDNDNPNLEKTEKKEKKEKKDKQKTEHQSPSAANVSTEPLSLPQTQLGLGSPKSGDVNEASTPLHVSAVSGSAFPSATTKKRSTKPPSASPLPRLANDGRSNEELRQALLAEGHTEDSIPVALLQEFAVAPSAGSEEKAQENPGNISISAAATSEAPAPPPPPAPKAKAPAPKGKASKAAPQPASKGLASFGFFKVASPNVGTGAAGATTPAADGAHSSAAVLSAFHKDLLFQGFEETARRVVPTALRLWGPSRPQVAHDHVFGGLPEQNPLTILAATQPRNEGVTLAFGEGDTPAVVQNDSKTTEVENNLKQHHRLSETIAVPTAAGMWLDPPVRFSSNDGFRPQIVSTNATMLERLLRCRLHKPTTSIPAAPAVATVVQPDVEASVMEVENPATKKADEDDNIKTIDIKTPQKAIEESKEFEAFTVAPLAVLAGDATRGEFFFPSDSIRHAIDIRKDPLAYYVTGEEPVEVAGSSNSNTLLSAGTHTTAPAHSAMHTSSGSVTISSPTGMTNNVSFGEFGALTYATEALLALAASYLTQDQIKGLQKQFQIINGLDEEQRLSPLSQRQSVSQDNAIPKPQIKKKRSLTAMLGSFCCEIIYTAFVSTTYKPFEIRPPYFGTFNNPLLPMLVPNTTTTSTAVPLYPPSLELLRAATVPSNIKATCDDDDTPNTTIDPPATTPQVRTAKSFGRFPPSEDISQLPDVPYDYESAEGWDSDRDSVDDVNASGETTEDDDSESSGDEDFINDGKVFEDDEEDHNDSEEELDAKQQQEQERRQRRALQLNALNASSFGPFGHLNLPQHPFHANYDFVEQLTYVHPKKFNNMAFSQWQQLEHENQQKKEETESKKKEIVNTTTPHQEEAAADPNDNDNPNENAKSTAASNASTPRGHEEKNKEEDVHSTSPPQPKLQSRVQPSWTRCNLNGMMPNFSSVYDQLMERLLVSHGVVSKEDMVAVEAQRRSAIRNKIIAGGNGDPTVATASSHLEGVESEAQKQDDEERRQRLLLSNRLEVTSEDVTALAALAAKNKCITLKSLYEAARAEHLCIGVSAGKLSEAISHNFVFSHIMKAIVLKSSLTPEMREAEEVRKAENRRKKEEIAERKRLTDEAIAAGLPPPVFRTATKAAANTNVKSNDTVGSEPPSTAAPAAPESIALGKWLTSAPTAATLGFSEAERKTAPKVYSKFDLGGSSIEQEMVPEVVAPQESAVSTAPLHQNTEPEFAPKYGLGLSSLSYLDEKSEVEQPETKSAPKRSRSPVDNHGA